MPLGPPAPRSLTVVQDDLFFAARVQSHAARLGLAVDLVSPEQAEAMAKDPGSVIVLQLTLNPDRQLALLERLRARTSAATVIAVSGHLETELRRRARRLGAVVASNSDLDRVLARACQVSG